MLIAFFASFFFFFFYSGCSAEDEVDRMMAGNETKRHFSLFFSFAFDFADLATELGLNQDKSAAPSTGIQKGMTMRGEEHLVDALMAGQQNSPSFHKKKKEENPSISFPLFPLSFPPIFVLFPFSLPLSFDTEQKITI
jgi:hypothetical protein